MVPTPPLPTDSPLGIPSTQESAAHPESLLPLDSRLSLQSNLPASTLCEGLLNDPLGYSGSLFHHSRNIWATDATGIAAIPPNSEAEYENSGIDPILWAEQFLADQDKEEKNEPNENKRKDEQPKD